LAILVKVIEIVTVTTLKFNSSSRERTTTKKGRVLRMNSKDTGIRLEGHMGQALLG
jgi:hypothetical protein